MRPILYYMPGSCALACHIALEWAGADYEARRIERDELSDPAFKMVNPKARVPALELGSTGVVTEALACLVAVAEQYPHAELLPIEWTERIRALEALAELTSEFHPAFFPIRVPSRFVLEKHCERSVRAKSFERVRARYDRWGASMDTREWTVGDGRSVVDAYLYVICRWSIAIKATIDEWPALAGFVERLEQDDGVVRAVRAEGLELVVS